MNLMERVRDALHRHGSMTVDELVHHLALDGKAVDGALRRLRASRALASYYTDGIWRYANRVPGKATCRRESA
jgi:hypothetical protein